MRNPTLEPLDVLVGEWALTLTDAWFLESREVRHQGRATARWLGDAFIELEAEMEGEHVWHFVLGHSDANNQLVALYHDPRPASRLFAMTFTGDEWTLHREDPDFHQRFVAHVSRDRIQGRWEASEDRGATWRKDFDLTFERTAIRGSGARRTRSDEQKPGARPPAPAVLDANLRKRLEPQTEEPPPASQMIDAKIKGLADWRGKTLSQLRNLIKKADARVVEEVKWRKPTNPMGVPVWSHDGIVCIGDALKNAVRLTFPKGALMKDPKELFNARLDSNSVRAIDFHEGETFDEAALKALILEAVQLNTLKKP